MFLQATFVLILLSDSNGNWNDVAGGVLFYYATLHLQAWERYMGGLMSYA
jgi:hypothetical protein